MKLNRPPLILALSLSAALALAGCGKSGNDAASTAPAAPSPSATVIAPAPQAPANGSLPSGDMSSTVMVANVVLGSKVDAATSKVTASGDSFAPKDAIYASVDTSGNGNGTLSAKWSYQDGQVVHQDSKSITSSGPQTTAFMISKPSGFPAGNYKVDISLDGKQVTSKDFSVK